MSIRRKRVVRMIKSASDAFLLVLSKESFLRTKLKEKCNFIVTCHFPNIFPHGQLVKI